MNARALVVRSGGTPFLEGREKLGVEIVEKVSHSIEPLVSGEESLREPADLVIFTSQVTVRRLFEEPLILPQFQGSLAGGQVAAVGRATADALARNGLTPDIVAEGSAESVLGEIPENLQGWRILLPRGQDATEDLPQALIRRGALVATLILYRKVPNPVDPAMEQAISEGAFAAFFPTSPSAARWLFTGIGEPAMNRLRHTPAVVLGPFTRKYLGAHGIERVERAREATFTAAAALLEMLAAGEQQT